MTIEDKEIIVILPLKTWRTVVAHLEGGVYRDVQPILSTIYAQVNPQAITAEKDAAERAAAEAVQAEAQEAARIASQPEGAADEPSEPHSSSQPAPALH